MIFGVEWKAYLNKVSEHQGFAMQSIQLIWFVSFLNYLNVVLEYQLNLIMSKQWE